MSRNYYIILGVPSSATQGDIKAAYRRLAKELHPDHYGKNHTPFQDLQEAYTVLSDPGSRRSYDDSLQKIVEIHQPQQREPARQPSVDIIEPLIPEGGPQSMNNHASEMSFPCHRPRFDSVHDLFFADFVDEARAYRLLLERLRVLR